MAKKQLIQIRGRRFSSDELTKDAKRLATIQINRSVEAAVEAIVKEINAIIKQFNVNSKFRNPEYRRLRSTINKIKEPEQPFGDLRAVVKDSGSGTKRKIQIIVQGPRGGENNAFNQLDAGLPAREVKGRMVNIVDEETGESRRVRKGIVKAFVRYEGHVVNKTGKIRFGKPKIGTQRRATRKSNIIFLYSAGQNGYKRNFRLKEVEPRNLYQRILESLQRQAQGFTGQTASNETLAYDRDKVRIEVKVAGQVIRIQ